LGSTVGRHTRPAAGIATGSFVSGTTIAFGAAAEPSGEISRLLPTIPSDDHDPKTDWWSVVTGLALFSPTCQT
jgi:hypothetical protein